MTHTTSKLTSGTPLSPLEYQKWKDAKAEIALMGSHPKARQHARLIELLKIIYAPSFVDLVATQAQELEEERRRMEAQLAPTEDDWRERRRREVETAKARTLAHEDDNATQPEG